MRRHSRAAAASSRAVRVWRSAHAVGFASPEGYEMNDDTQTPGAGPQGTGQESSLGGGASEWSTVPPAQPPAPPAPPAPAQSLEPLPPPPPASPAGGYQPVYGSQPQTPPPS